MDYVAQPADYRITPNAVAVALNIMGDANRVQCSVASGASIKCYIEGVEGLEYSSNHQYQEWAVSIAPTFFNTDTEKYIYAAIPKDSSQNTALIVFPSEKLDIYGKNALDAQIGPTSHYYIWLQAVISAVTTEDDVSFREWTSEINDGLLETDQAIAAKMITSLKVNGVLVPVEDSTVSITVPQHASQLDNDVNYISESDVTAGSDKINVGNKSLNLVHNHDWSDIVNKPNLVEGVMVGLNKLSFKLVNGDVIEADFSYIVNMLTRKAGRAGTAANRPEASEVSLGDMYIDTTLNKPIWAFGIQLNSVVWLDGEGNTYLDHGT